MFNDLKYYTYKYKDGRNYLVIMAELDKIEFCNKDAHVECWFSDFDMQINFLNESVELMLHESKKNKTENNQAKTFTSNVKELSSEEFNLELNKIRKIEDEPGSEE